MRGDMIFKGFGHRMVPSRAPELYNPQTLTALETIFTLRRTNCSQTVSGKPK